jgi:sugar lactone lactonase YvrE
MRLWSFFFLLITWALAQGPVSLTVGGPESGFVDGPREQARMFKPIRLAALDDDSVVFADINNHAIRRLTRGGVVSTLVGGPDKQGYLDGPAGEARLRSPHGVAVRADGTIAVADAGNDAIRLLTPEGKGQYRLTTLAGQPGQGGDQDGPNEQARFRAPHSLCWGGLGELYVADIGNASVRKIFRGQTSTVVKGGMKYPMDLALDSKQNLWIADAGLMQLWRWNEGAGLSAPFPNLKLQMPHGISLAEDDSIFVAEMHAHRIVLVDLNGTPTPIWESGLNRPAALLWERGGLWIADLGHHRILRLNLL